MRLALIALALIAAPAVAQMPKEAPGKPDPARVAAGSYTVETSHTQVRFGVLHMGFNPYFGTFSQATGMLMLDPANPSATSVTIEVPIASVQTPSDKLTEELKSPQFFDGAKFPTMKFVSSKVTISGTHATIMGQLTMHGVTRPVTLDAMFVGAGSFMGKDQVGFTATGTVNRSDFGVTYGVPLVTDTVTIDITAAFQKAG